MHLVRKIQNRYRSMPLLTVVAVILILISAVPWFWPQILNEGQTVLGLPFLYFFSLYLIPAIILTLLVVFGFFAEDIDRHNVEFENE